MNKILVAFKHVPFNGEFIHNGIEYIKGNFNRGYYFENGRKVFRNFKKKIEVEVSGEYYL